MLQIMANHVLRSILLNIQSSPFVSVMVDETTDKSNKEQLTMIMRWVSNDFAVGEEFLVCIVFRQLLHGALLM